MAAKQQHLVVLVLGGPAAGLSGWGLCNGSLLVNLLTLMAMHGVVNIFLGKIGKIIPKLLVNGQIRPRTFPQAKLVSNCWFWLQLRPSLRLDVDSIS